jgi:hypothetical protein
MLHAMEQIRRMRGGTQSHLMRCSDGHDHDLYYVVKFQNNSQHSRVLVNELLGTRLAARMGLPVPPVAVIGVGQGLIRVTPALCIELPRSRTPCGRDCNLVRAFSSGRTVASLADPPGPALRAESRTR